MLVESDNIFPFVPALFHLPNFSKLTHVVIGISVLFLSKAEYHPIAWIYHILFIWSFIYRHLDCFYLSAIMNNAAGNIGIIIPYSLLLIEFIFLFERYRISGLSFIFFFFLWLIISSQFPLGFHCFWWYISLRIYWSSRCDICLANFKICLFCHKL